MSSSKNKLPCLKCLLDPVCKKICLEFKLHCYSVKSAPYLKLQNDLRRYRWVQYYCEKHTDAPNFWK